MSIYQHFRKFEHVFVDQVLSWMELVERNYTPYITDFLDPREQQILGSLIGTNHDVIKFAFFGGYEESERKRACIAPIYEQIDEIDFGVELLEGKYQQKFISLKHKDILGTLMSQGIDRRTVGDIVLSDGVFQFFLTSEIASYVKLNMTKIKQAAVQLEERPFNTVIQSDEKWVKQEYTLSSMRLDVFLKEIYKISRQDAAQLIKQNKVKINFKLMDDNAIQLMENDLISVRGFGRSKLIEIVRTTRKNKLKIIAARLKE